MNRKLLLNAALYFAAFSAAYAGFFYQEYTAREQDDTLRAGSSLAAQTGSTQHYSLPFDASRNDAAESGSSAETFDPAGRSARGTRPVPEITRVNAPHRDGIDRDAVAALNSNEEAYFVRRNGVTSRDGRRAQEGYNERRHTRSEELPVTTVAMFSAVTSGYNASQIPPVGRSYDYAASGSSTDPVGIGPGSTDTTRQAADAGNTGPGGDFETSGDYMPADSGEDSAFNPDFTPRQDTETAEQPWPTPNCPIALPQGSSATDAKNMQQTYGCRYAQYCRMLNDGTGGHMCWWGFYAAS